MPTQGCSVWTNYIHVIEKLAFNGLQDQDVQLTDLADLVLVVDVTLDDVQTSFSLSVVAEVVLVSRGYDLHIRVVSNELSVDTSS